MLDDGGVELIRGATGMFGCLGHCAWGYANIFWVPCIDMGNMGLFCINEENAMAFCKEVGVRGIPCMGMAMF